MKRLLVLVTLLTSMATLRAGISDPCLAVKIPLNERIEAARAVVYGRVISQQAVWDDAQRSIYTINRAVVSDVWKATDAVSDTITVITEGGDMGTMGRTVIGTLKLVLGDEGYLLLESQRPQDVTFTKYGVRTFMRPYSEVQALLVRTEDGSIRDCWGTVASTSTQLIQRVLSAYTHEARKALQRATSIRSARKAFDVVQGSVTFTPKRVIGGIGDVITVTGSGFGAQRGSSYVTFTTDGTNYHGADAAKGFAYRAWSDSEIKVEVPPSYSGRVRVVVGTAQHESADTLRVMSNVAARSVNPLSYNTLINTNGTGGYTWSLQKELFDNSVARECVESVMRQFRCKTGMSFDLAPMGTTAGYALNDGINAIVFDAPGYELGAGAVAYCDWIWYSCILGNETFYWVRDTDCRLSRRFNWYYGNGKNPQFGMAKLRYVLYHEIGHAHQFGHVNEWGESMHPIVQALPAEEWLERDTITASEQRAGQFMTNLGRTFTFRACGVQPLLAPSLADCNSDPTSGVHEHDASSSTFDLAPMPASTSITLTDDHNADLDRTVTVLDVRSVRVYTAQWSQGSSTLDLNISQLAAGQYTVLVQTRQGVAQSRAFVVTR